MTFIFNPFRNAKEGCQGRRFQLKCDFLFDTILDTERKRMKRRDFLSVGAVAGLAAIPALGACTSPKKNCCGMPKLAVPKQPAQLNLALQWNGIPVADEVDAKLDFLEANGFPCVVSSALPHLPDRALAVSASDLRPAGDTQGSRFQIVVRGQRNMDTALPDSMAVIELLHGFYGQLTPEAPHVQRITLESGAANLGEDDCGRSAYSMNFRAWI
jgi:hypothetical protein